MTKNKSYSYLKTFTCHLAKVRTLMAVIFLAAQFIGAAHAAAHGSEPHEHEGHPCIIGTAVHQLEHADLPATTTPEVLVAQPYIYIWLQAERLSTFDYIKAAAIRAPPQI